MQEITARKALMLDQFLFFAFKSVKVVQNVTLSSGNFGRDLLVEFFVKIKNVWPKKVHGGFCLLKGNNYYRGLP